MAWTTPLTAVANAALTAAQWNASVRDNLNETAPAKAVTVGAIFMVTATNQIQQRKTTADTYLGGGTDVTNSQTYTGLTGGPSIGLTSEQASIVQSARISIDTAGGTVFYSHEISGATTQAASDNWAIRHDSHTANRALTVTAIAHWPAGGTLQAGANVYTMRCRTAGAYNATLGWRQLMAIPI